MGCGGVVGGGGGVKSFRSEGSKQWGSLFRSDHRRSNGSAADKQFSVGGSNPGPPTVAGGGGAVFTRPGFEPPTEKTRVGCATIRPLLDVVRVVSPLLGAASATDKKPKLCVAV